MQVLRWVRYEAPVMVCVNVDGDGNDVVVSVVIGEEPEDIRLARDTDGQPLIYDEHMDRLDPEDPTAQRAAREAEDRQWPEAGTWESGPDALRFPRLYDPVDPDEGVEGDDLEPLDLNSAPTSGTT
jgi:hypothetical protein